MDTKTKYLEKIKSIDVNGVFKAQLHYAHVSVVSAGDGYFLELAGMVGFDQAGKLVSGSAKGQTVKIFSNIELVIERVAREHGLNIPEAHALDFIVATRADVVNLSQNAREVNEGYIISQIPKVARTMVGVAELPLNALVEITARAYLKRV